MFSQLSKELTNTLTSDYKKKNGIYFTPPSCIQKILSLINFDNVKSILEPSCGSGEFLLRIHEKYPNIPITGVELCEPIYKSVQHLQNDMISIVHADFLKYPLSSYDLVIGNPPYFVMSKNQVDQNYSKFFDGRPNIFILFILKSLTLLNPNGILCFVLPKNFLTCLYYNKTREHIAQNFQILHIELCTDDKYIETQQETILFIIQKIQKIQKVDNSSFVRLYHTFTIFAPPEINVKLDSCCTNSTTLYKLGCKIKIGTVIWNENKNALTHDDTQTRLIYSSDIVQNTLTLKKYKNEQKKNYISKPGVTDPCIIINRGYGSGAYKFTYCIVDSAKPYLLENHVISIHHDGILDKDKKDKLLFYKKIIKSFDDEKTKLFIAHYFGNNAINTTEMYHIFPIFNI